MWQVGLSIGLSVLEALIIGAVSIAMIKVKLDWIRADLKKTGAEVKEAKEIATRAHKRLDRLASAGRMQ